MDNERDPPRVVLEIELAEVGRLLSQLRAARSAGVEGVLVPVSGDPAAAIGALRPMAEAPAELVLLVGGSPAVAAALGAGLVLPERGMASSEARRLLGPAALLAREVSTPAVADVASGIDAVVAGPAATGNSAALIRQFAGSAHGPVLWRASDPEAVRLALAGGAEGVVVSARGPGGYALAVAAARWLPERRREPNTVVVDGRPVAWLPDTAVTDLLADLGMRPTRVVLNRVPLPRSRWDDAVLRPGDDIRTDPRG